MKRILLAAAGLAALAVQPALAADLKVRKAAPPPPPIPVAAGWSGFYIGGHFGGARGEIAAITDTITAVKQDTQGGLAGGQVGFNWQTGSWVLGVEGDWSWARITGTSRCPTLIHQCSSELDWLATARGRLGYATGPMLFYVTGGGAWGDQRITVTGLTPAAALFEGTATRTMTGWTAGVGLEWQIIPAFPNLSLKAEWLHYNLGGENNVNVCGGVVGAAGAAIGCVVNGLRHTGHLVRGGLNYRFTWGGGPIAAAY